MLLKSEPFPLVGLHGRKQPHPDHRSQRLDSAALQGPGGCALTIIGVTRNAPRLYLRLDHVALHARGRPRLLAWLSPTTSTVSAEQLRIRILIVMVAHKIYVHVHKQTCMHTYRAFCSFKSHWCD